MAEVTIAALVRLFEGTPRQGPGDSGVLERMITALAPGRGPRVADLGCGSGGTAIHLAERFGAEVVAVDAAPPLLAALERRLAARPLVAGRVLAREGDMLAPGIDAGSLDLIVSEGAAYSVGFGNALRAWRPLVKPGGGLVVSECVWFGGDRPAEATAFWEENYPDMGSVADAVRQGEATGWRLVASERLPAAAWWGPFYDPLLERMTALAPEAEADPELAAAVSETEREMHVMRRYGGLCGYQYFAFDAPR